MTQDTVWHSTFPLHVWKAEYNARPVGSSLFFEVAGRRLPLGVGARRQVDGAADRGHRQQLRRRAACGPPTCAGIGRRATRSLAYAKQGWGGNHNFKLGAEVMRDLLVQPFAGFPGASQALSVRNNNVATQVDIYLPGSESKNGLWTYSLFLNDSWQAGRRLTVNAGLRFDRHSAYLPDQVGPAGQSLRRVDDIVTFNNWGPRLSASFDLTGDAKTLAKASWGRFWLYPGADLGVGPQPERDDVVRALRLDRRATATASSTRANRARCSSCRAARAATTFDENLENTYVDQFTAYVEREVMSNFGVRTGFVWNGRRQVRGQINVNRPLDVYDVPVTFRDPGPDGRVATGDDGDLLTGYNLSAEALARPIVNITTNLPEADSDYYTWEFTATKRESQLLVAAGQLCLHLAARDRAHRRRRVHAQRLHQHRRHAAGVDDVAGQAAGDAEAQVGRPPDADRAPSGRQPVRPHLHPDVQLGQRHRARPSRSTPQRMPNVNVFDVRTEKAFRAGLGRVTAFFDVYNVFNTNAEQELTTTAGASWLRPVAITPPRIARVGVRFAW